VFYFDGGVVPAGQFSFPFQVQVPNWLPPSFLWKYRDMDEKYKASIKYKIKAYIQDRTGRDKPIYGKRVLLINPPMPPPGQSAELHAEKNVTSCCCIDQGPVSVNCMFEKNVYFPNESVRAIVNVDSSKCTGTCEHISLKLMREVRIRAGGTQKGKDFKMAGMREPGFEAKSTVQKMMNLDLNSFSAQFGSQLNAQRKKGKMYAEEEIYLASKVQASVNSRLISCNYFIVVKPNYGSCDCCRNPPSVKLPLSLINPQMMEALT